MKFTKTQIAKKAVRLTAGYAIGTASYNIIRGVIPKSDNPVANFAVAVSIYAAAYGVSGAIEEAAGSFTDAQIDQLVRSVVEAREEMAHQKVTSL